ncbi:hypothetical protein NDU88_000331 [Pleurodeles waltl]|uniref:Uncharacterized protein n=1 Tax=Pleurodeles waltl TaxID=8319 RepID=A0AAV7UPN6_PLEWA|nr:hypothetical protein NDU88_000331 [Pleurodeles waltl]
MEAQEEFLGPATRLRGAVYLGWSSLKMQTPQLAASAGGERPAAEGSPASGPVGGSLGKRWVTPERCGRAVTAGGATASAATAGGGAGSGQSPAAARARGPRGWGCGATAQPASERQVTVLYKGIERQPPQHRRKALLVLAVRERSG